MSERLPQEPVTTASKSIIQFHPFPDRYKQRVGNFPARYFNLLNLSNKAQKIH